MLRNNDLQPANSTLRAQFRVTARHNSEATSELYTYAALLAVFDYKTLKNFWPCRSPDPLNYSQVLKYRMIFNNYGGLFQEYE